MAVKRTQRRVGTLMDVARAAGVSVATASNAYNRPDQLSAAVRERVMATAREIGYPGPNPVARTLQSGVTGNIGVIFHELLSYAFSDPTSALFLEGIAKTCEHQAAGLLLTSPTPSLGGDNHDTISAAMVDGFIAYSCADDDHRLQTAQDRGLPLVTVDGPVRPGAPWVGIDDRAAARSAIEHLMAMGHRRFGIITLPLNPDGFEGRVTPRREAAASFRVTRERLAGYRDGLTGGGLSWQGVPVEERAGNGFNAGYRAAASLLARRTPPSAILAMSDELAAGTLRAASDRGIAVPAALSVLGFDDVPAAARMHPALTTIGQPHAEKGAVAARLVLEHGSDPDARVMLPTQLIVRASSSPPG